MRLYIALRQQNSVSHFETGLWNRCGALTHLRGRCSKKQPQAAVCAVCPQGVVLAEFNQPMTHIHCATTRNPSVLGFGKLCSKPQRGWLHIKCRGFAAFYFCCSSFILTPHFRPLAAQNFPSLISYKPVFTPVCILCLTAKNDFCLKIIIPVKRLRESIWPWRQTGVLSVCN